jgi:hypothetical protein
VSGGSSGGDSAKGRHVQQAGTTFSAANIVFVVAPALISGVVAT